MKLYLIISEYIKKQIWICAHCTDIIKIIIPYDDNLFCQLAFVHV